MYRATDRVLDGIERDETVKVPVSRSFKDRFQFGRRERQRFYALMACEEVAKGLFFTNSLEDMVADAPDVPLSVRSKMAVIHADGNRFGRIRERTKGIEGHRMFSADLKAKQAALLQQILKWLRGGRDGPHWPLFAVEARPGHKQVLGLRFETLLWGGDEMIFAVPAWLAVPFIEGFFAFTRGWTAPAGDRLTHSLGVVICPTKTPIRQVKTVAAELTRACKELQPPAPPGQAVQTENLFQIEVFESVAMPDTDVGRYRKNLYGVDDETLRGWSSIKGEQAAEFFGRLVRLKTSDDDGLPRSQLYQLLRDAAALGAFMGRAEQSDRDLRERLELYLSRAGAGKKLTRQDVDVLAGVTGTGPSVKVAPFAFSLAAVAALWDYVAPVDDATIVPLAT
jgi:hypothetical protein